MYIFSFIAYRFTALVMEISSYMYNLAFLFIFVSRFLTHLKLFLYMSSA